MDASKEAFIFYYLMQFSGILLELKESPNSFTMNTL